VGRDELAELVDDDEQRGQRVQRRSLRPSALVLQRRCVAAGPAQQLLPADELALKGVAHALDQGRLVGEVGDGGRHMGQAVEAEKGGPTFEVNQHKIENFR
jgi:hypothetical protein